MEYGPFLMFDVVVNDCFGFEAQIGVFGLPRFEEFLLIPTWYVTMCV